MVDKQKIISALEPPKEEKAMERLTTDQPLGIMQNCLNLFYAKDGEAWVRDGGPGPLHQDVRLFDFIREAIRAAVDEERTYVADFSDEELGEIMLDWLADGNTSVEGLIGTLYTAAWAFAEIRARLKSYEDTGLDPKICANYKQFEDEAISKGVPFSRIVELMEADRAGRLVVLPCKVGDIVYDIQDARIYPTRVLGFSRFGTYWACKTVSSYPSLEQFGKRIFLTREEAEAVLKGEKHETNL